MFGHSLAPVANKDIEKNQINDDENNGKWSLSPAYDLLNVNLANTKDKEELALSLEEKKTNSHAVNLNGLVPIWD
jgi:serine/threonine-protein kinase HipA